MNRVAIPSFLVALGLVLGACAAPAATPAPTTVPTPEPMPMEPSTTDTIVDIAVADGRFSTLVGALESAGLVEALQGEGPYTVFAPTDDAFAALPAGTLESLSVEQLTDILLYHVVSGKVMAADVLGLDGQLVDTLLDEKQIAVSIDGDTVGINDSKVAIPDIAASNGVIHVIDRVLLPPSDEGMGEMGTIVDIAVADGRFSTLVGALESAGLVEALQGQGPYTVFAPTDDAFAALPAGTLESLSVEQLTDILLYHVVPGKVMAADVVGLNGQSADTLLDGKQLAIVTDGGTVKIGGATVVITDIVTSNGVIHVIDTVLLPPV
ncbi:MAG TPA: fasciclin domain-containing protein [Anaerolineales bacterium]|nr:fasciclin domain-containing protein [Anaerolineales bacterium]